MWRLVHHLFYQLTTLMTDRWCPLRFLPPQGRDMAWICSWKNTNGPSSVSFPCSMLLILFKGMAGANISWHGCHRKSCQNEVGGGGGGQYQTAFGNLPLDFYHHYSHSWIFLWLHLATKLCRFEISFPSLKCTVLLTNEFLLLDLSISSPIVYLFQSFWDYICFLYFYFYF